jgi:hypothetical protein
MRKHGQLRIASAIQITSSTLTAEVLTKAVSETNYAERFDRRNFNEGGK